MKYALLIYSPPEGSWEALSEEEQNSIMGEYFAISRVAGRRRRRAAPARGDGHHASASRTASTLTTDGPFADTKEMFGGFYLLEADDLDKAIEVAARDPGRPPGRSGGGAPDRGALA